MTWNDFRRQAARLVMVAGADVADEVSFWIAESFEAEGNYEEAMRRFIYLVGARSGTKWGTQSAESVKTLLLRYAEQQDWVRLASFQDGYPNLFAVLSPGPQLMFQMGEAFRHLQLPEDALEWYDRILTTHPSSQIREEALARKVLAAAEIHEDSTMQEAGQQYEQEYPGGRWIVDVSSHLGRLALQQQQFTSAQQHYAIMLSHVTDEDMRLQIRRRLLRIQYQAGDIDKAIQGYRDLMHDKVATDEDRLMYADVLFDVGRIKEAVQEYELLVERIPSPKERVWAQYRLALSYRAQGRVDESKTMLAQLAASEDVQGEFGSAVRAAASAQQMEIRLVTTEEIREKNKK